MATIKKATVEKKPTVIKKTEPNIQEKPMLDMDTVNKMIQLAVAQALESTKSKEIENNAEVVKVDFEKKRREVDTTGIEKCKVVLTNNTFGKFVVGLKKSRSGGALFLGTMDEHGDSCELEYSEYIEYASQNLKFFKSGELVISDVIGYDYDSFILKNNLAHLYLDKYKVTELENIFDAPYNEFSDFLNANTSIFETALILSCELYKVGKFNHGDKQAFFRNIVGANSLPYN